MKTMNLGRISVILLATMMLSACFGSGGGGTTVTTSVSCPDGSSAQALEQCPVAVVTATPADGATNAPVDGSIVFTSNVDIFEQLSYNDHTIPVTKVTVTKDGVAVAGSVNHNARGGNFDITFTPTRPFLPLATYVATVEGNDNLYGFTKPGRVVTLTIVFTTGCGGTVTDTTTCALPMVNYTDKVYELAGDVAQVFAVTKVGVTEIVNKSHNTELASCSLGVPKLVTGQVLVNCGGRGMVYIDPATDTAYDYVGTVPADIVWVRSSPYDPLHPTWYTGARVSDGWYFSLSDRYTLRFQDDVGVVTIVNEGTDPYGYIRALVSYNN